MATPRSGAPKRTPVSAGRPGTKSSAPAPSSLFGIDPKYHTPIFIGLIFLSLIIFFSGPIFSGGLFGASDFISWESFRPYLAEVDKKGESPLWIPYIFSGMPALASLLVTGDRWWDLTMKLVYSAEHIVGFINYPVTRVVFHYFIYGLGMFLLMRSKKAARSTAFFVSLAAMFSTWIIIYIMIGHNTKIMVLMTFPYIFLLLERLIERWSILHTGLLILALHIAWEAGHQQTAFYGVCAIGIYLTVEFIGSLTARINADRTGIAHRKRDETSRMGRIGLAIVSLIVAAGFTVGMGADRLSELNQYIPYSTRGAASITEDPNHQKSALAVGHGYEYATNWSFSPEEVITFLVPGYYGFGKVALDMPGAPQPPRHEMLYWGQMDFTDAAHYMGIAVLILGVFGLWMNRSNRFVQALAVIGLFGLLLSFGRNSLGFLYDTFYNLVPGFSKFRAPSQSLVLLEFVFPILAGFGIESLIAMHKTRENPRVTRTILYGTIAFGVFMLIGLAGSSILKSSFSSSIAASGKQVAQYPEIIDYIFKMAMTDWAFGGFFGIATFLAMYLYLKGKLTPTLFKTALLLILVIDLWRIDYRPMETVPASSVEQTFRENDIDQFLKNDPSKHRIMNLTTGPNYPARQFQEHILGYSSVKMRSYQNLLDIAGDGNRPTSPLAQRILNTSYLITPPPQGGAPQNYQGMTIAFQSQQTGAVVYKLDDPLPRAWFVNRVDVLDEKTTLERIRDNAFDPRDVAYVTQPLTTKIDPIGYTAGMQGKMTLDSTGALTPDTTAAAQVGASQGGGSVSITRYEPHHITMDVQAPGTNFLVISEIHYPPGWRATIDGTPADIIQTNYLLRGLVVPAGKHTIEMNYVTDGFETGKYLSLGLNLAMFGLIIAGVMIERRRGPVTTDPVHDAPVIAEDDV